MDLKGSIYNMGQHSNAVVSLRCPGCRRDGTFTSIDKDLRVDTKEGRNYFVGSRSCPNPACQAHVFTIVAASDGGLVASYPAETIDFDASNLPPKVLVALEEAIKCHAAGCYTAAAMMIRKTLEVVCDDQGAKKGNLHDRIESLSKQIVLPQGMAKALHNLRLLGNDAAHVESTDYDAVGKEEVEIAMSVVKEILKATYQLQGIMAKLEGLKKANQAAGAP